MRVGIDAEEVERIKKLASCENKRSQIFCQPEIDYAQQQANPFEHYAGFFCAKEAYFKAVGTGISGLGSLKNICVLHDENKKPYLMAYGKRIESISISHTKVFAQAIVILEDEK